METLCFAGMNVKQAKAVAKDRYQYLLQAKNRLIDKLPAGKGSRQSAKLVKAQMRVYAGIYNRDYAMYKKGVDGCEKCFFKDTPDVTIVVVSAALATQASKEKMKEKLDAYKDFYNQLPRGFFKEAA